MGDRITTEDLRKAGVAAGLVTVGVTTAEPFEEARQEIFERDRSGFRGGLGFTYKDPARSTDIRSSFPWARNLVVAGRAYLPDGGSPGTTTETSGRIARFAVTDPYGPLRQALGEVAALLKSEGHRTEILIDDDRLVDRAAAVRAGVGWQGKSTNVLAPGVGPWMVLGSIVTDADLEPTSPMERGCGTCTACIPACPTAALTPDGRIDASRCLAALSQTAGVFPVEFREVMGDRVYGCDDCLTSCPPGERLMIRSSANRGRVALEDLLTSDDETLLGRFSHFYHPKRRPDTLRRNALIAAGNSADKDLVPLVAAYAGHPIPLLRLHAIWALTRLGGPVAEAVLSHRRRRETDPLVIGDGFLAA
ncbi:MAG: tRNA epoxyqueuosine(34) reductase QueG [Acidimicrobiia bacterium]|nr:tRNA epoxyqueuosine(34) reductase QueG [Acidimicrobiia bacterium]